MNEDLVARVVIWAYVVAMLSLPFVGWWSFRHEMKKLNNNEREQHEEV